MKFTRRTYYATYNILLAAAQDAWLAYAENDDHIDYLAYKIIQHKQDLLCKRYFRETGRHI